MNPSYVDRAAKEKYGRNIQIVGAPKSEINAFWKNIRYSASKFECKPKEVGRSIVDINSKTHTNHGDKVDEIDVTSEKSKAQKKSKSYQLQLGKEWDYQVGGSVSLNAIFFNASAGGSVNRNSYKKASRERRNEETLTQDFQLKGSVKVAPKSKVIVMISTWSVTYQADMITKVSSSTGNKIAVRYKILGGLCTKVGEISAADIFKHETNFETAGTQVYFDRKSTISYLGEEVEVIKNEEVAK